MNYAYAALALIVTGAGGAWAGYGQGYDQGVLVTTSQQNADQVEDLGQRLTGLADDVRAGAEVSRQVREIMTKIASAQSASTRDLKNALAKNAADPVLCRFDADSMRIIEAARAAAAQAAAGGIRGALPAAD